MGQEKKKISDSDPLIYESEISVAPLGDDIECIGKQKGGQIFLSCLVAKLCLRILAVNMRVSLCGCLFALSFGRAVIY